MRRRSRMDRRISRQYAEKAWALLDSHAVPASSCSNKLRKGIGMKQNRILLLLAVSFLALLSSRQIAAQSSASITLVKAGRLLDPRTGNVLSPAAVLIEGNKSK